MLIKFKLFYLCCVNHGPFEYTNTYNHKFSVMYFWDVPRIQQLQCIYNFLYVYICLSFCTYQYVVRKNREIKLTYMDWFFTYNEYTITVVSF